MSDEGDETDDGDTIELPNDDPVLLKATIEFIRSATDEDKKRLFRENPKLLSAGCVDLLRHIEGIHRGRGDVVNANGISAIRDIVEAAIAHGVDFAFLQQVVFVAIVRSPDDLGEMRAYVASIGDRFPELLAPNADAVVDGVAGKYGPDSHLPEFLHRIGASLRGRREVLAVAERSPADAMTFESTASSLIAIYERSGDVDRLDRAIAYLQSAIICGARPSPILNQLGIAYKLRYDACDSSDDIAFSVCCHWRAVEIGPADNPEYFALLDHYALALRAQYRDTSDQQLLDQAIRTGRRAALLAVGTHDDEALTLENLAGTLMMRWGARQEPDDIREALELYERARAVAASDGIKCQIAMNQSGALLQNAILTKNDSDLHRAREVFDEASAALSDSPVGAFHVGETRALQAFDAQLFEDVVRGYRLAEGAMRELVLFTERTSAAKQSWLQEFQWLVAKAAYSLAALGRVDEAVAELESGLSLLLWERRQRSGAALIGLLGSKNERARQQFIDAAAELGRVAGAANAPLGEIAAARRSYREAISTIRTIPGSTRFFEKATIEDVYAALDDSVAVVYFLSTTLGGLALVVHGHRVVPIRLPGLDSSSVQALLYGSDASAVLRKEHEISFDEAEGYVGSLWRWREDIAAKISDPAVISAWSKAFDDARRWLYDHALSALLEKLREFHVSRVVFVPVSELVGLPLHAAHGAPEADGRERCVFDTVDVSYAPSVTTVGTASHSDLPQRPARAICFGDSGALAYAELEARLVATTFELGTPATEPQDDWSATIASMPSYDVWHFACHSEVNREENRAGSLILPGGMRLHADQIPHSSAKGPALVTLSACETSAASYALLTENISVATDFIGIGATNVVATAWPVEDLDTCIFMTRFYTVLPAEGWDVARALRVVQQWVRDSTNAEKLTFMRGFPSSDIPVFEGLAHVVAELTARPPNADGRDSPISWSAFQAIGVPAGTAQLSAPS